MILNRNTHTHVYVCSCTSALFFRECPTSTSMEEEAIQGMLSMAGLHYTTCLPSHTQTTDSTDRRSFVPDHRSYSKNRHKDKMSSQSYKPEYGKLSCCWIFQGGLKINCNLVICNGSVRFL